MWLEDGVLNTQYRVLSTEYGVQSMEGQLLCSPPAPHEDRHHVERDAYYAQ